jgi:DNA-binding transcriptional MerR regulator
MHMIQRTDNRVRRLRAGQAAAELGVGVQTLHYYEREGLIPEPPRTDSGYRLYSPELIERVRFIRKAQALGLPLSEIREILSLARQGASPCGRVQSVLAEKLREVDARLRELQSFRDELAALVRQAPDLSAHADRAQLCAIVEEALPLPPNRIAAAPLAHRGMKE